MNVNKQLTQNQLTLSCPGTGGAVVKIGHSNLWPGSKELLSLQEDVITTYKIPSNRNLGYWW